MELELLISSPQGNNPGLARWAQSSHQGPEKWEREAERQLRGCNARRVLLMFGSFEDEGRGPGSGTWKRQGSAFSPRDPEGASPADP